ncbi:MAG: ferritin-like protein [Mucilaginibacter sp.]|nr:ferritin-like protein [Mucilaginibacter sp.]
MTIADPILTKLLKQAYSAEKAAAFAYQGHAGAVRNKGEKLAIKQIEIDEWNHREEVLKLMNLYHVPVSKWFEVKNYIIGKTISASCYVIGWFMPFYFAGNLESGNVCEYVRMKRLFNALDITGHDEVLYEMSLKEKEHEVYFYEQIKDNKMLPFFERFFAWGEYKRKNDIDLEKGFYIADTNTYCEGFREKKKTLAAPAITIKEHFKQEVILESGKI